MIVDDTSLYDGMKNLATGYFDTVAEYNRAHTKKKHHFSFQTVKDMNWGAAVGRILGKENAIGDIQEGMKTMFTAATKAGAVAAVGLIAGGEAFGIEALGKAALGAFTDLVVEGSTRAFGVEEDEDDTFVQGTWVYVYRGKEHNKLIRNEELAGETSMFFDSDQVLQKDEARKLYSPGFYISHLSASHQTVVYVFDTQGTVTVTSSDVRRADPADSAKYDADSGMTLIRELYFRRLTVKSIEYAKFQVGDEVYFEGNKYAVTGGDAETLHLRDKFNNAREVDPEACTAGPKDHWRAEKPDQFRTVSFTFGVGDFAYRPLAGGDYPPTSRANGVLCCIFFYNGTHVEVFDCWTGESTIVLPNDLVKPPLQIRRLLSTDMAFSNFQKRIVKRMSPEHHKLALHTAHEETCWGYDYKLDFIDTRVLTADRTQTQVTLGATGGMVEGTATGGEVMMQQKQSSIEPDPPDVFPMKTWIAGGMILAGIYFL